MACGYNNYIRRAKIQNGLRPVNNAKNKKVFFFGVSFGAKREKRKDNLVITDE